LLSENLPARNKKKIRCQKICWREIKKYWLSENLLVPTKKNFRCQKICRQKIKKITPPENLPASIIFRFLQKV